MTTNKDMVNEALKLIVEKCQNENVKVLAMQCHDNKEKTVAILSLVVMLCRLWPLTFEELVRQVHLPGDSIEAVDELN